jgi:tetratricopeptide (TPR) repeat protein
MGGDALPLQTAIDSSAQKLAEMLPGGTRVAMVAFTSDSENLSNYIMDELAAALFESGIEVADRSNMEYVYRKFNVQMSGDVSDESAVDIGQFLGAQYVLSGQLVKAGGVYRYRLAGINVETRAQEGSSHLNVQNDRALKNLVAYLKKSSATTASYGENTAQPRTAGSFLDRGLLFAVRGDFDLAIEDFTEAINLNGDFAAAFLQRGKAYLAKQSKLRGGIAEDFDFTIIIDNNGKKTGDHERAIADVSQAIRLQPNNAVAYNWRALVYNNIAEWDSAIADSNQTIKLNPHYETAYNNRGLAYYYKGDNDRAIADCSQAIKLDPYFAMAYFNRSLAYLKKGDNDRAIADCSQAVKLDPYFAIAYINRGNAYYHKGDDNRAIADYSQAIKLDPNLAVAYINRGVAYKNKGDYDGAIADYEAALRLDPSNAIIKKNLDSARRQLGK